MGHSPRPRKGQDSMIDRYTRPEMGGVWTEDNRYRKCLDVELAVCDAWARIDEIETVVQHDIIAFLTSVAEHVGPNSRYIHLGLTSYDVVDTALSLLIKESLENLLGDLRAFH